MVGQALYTALFQRQASPPNRRTYGKHGTMDKLRFKSLNQMAEATATALAQGAAASAFHLFRDEQFRRSAGFEQLSQTEQDRIFNELVVGYVVLTMLVLEAPDLGSAGEFRDYLASLNKRVPKASWTT